MKTKTRTDRLVLAYALVAIKGLRKRDAAYREECEEYAKQGYAPHYCKHGTNLWTDYDNICGPCEDSASNYEIALAYGHETAREYMKRVEMIVQVSASGFFSREVTEQMVNELLAWDEGRRNW